MRGTGRNGDLVGHGIAVDFEHVVQKRDQCHVGEAMPGGQSFQRTGQNVT